MISSKVTESIYGKQSSSDNSLTAKSRLLQSMWRVENGLQIALVRIKIQLTIKQVS